MQSHHTVSPRGEEAPGGDKLLIDLIVIFVLHIQAFAGFLNKQLSATIMCLLEEVRLYSPCNRAIILLLCAGGDVPAGLRLAVHH